MAFPAKLAATLTVVGLAILPCRAGGAETEDVRTLREEVAKRGWIVFAAHPAEIDGGRIIEKRDARGPLDLYLARPDGTQLRNITNTSDAGEFGGRFSPDGKKLLYRRLPADGQINHDLWGQTGELIIARADGSEPVVHGEAGAYPWASFSPDVKQIACLHKKEGKIRIFDLATKRLVREMDARGIFQQLFWSPDGKRLVGTANVAGRPWNVVSIDLETEKLTLLTRALNCTPDWFRGDPTRVIYSNRNPALFPGKYGNNGLTMLMWAGTDGKHRRLIYGNASKHCYFACLSPDDKHVIFGDDGRDGLIVGELRVIRMADAPIIPEGIKELRPLHPGYKEGPVVSLRLPSGMPLRGFEPDWTDAKLEPRRE